MALINFQKVSGVILVSSGGTNQRNYSGSPKCTFNQTSDGLGMLITIDKDSYQVSLTDLQVNGQTPTTISTATVLLNSLFSS